MSAPTDEEIINLLPRVLNNLEMLRDIVQNRMGDAGWDLTDLIEKISAKVEAT